MLSKVGRRLRGFVRDIWGFLGGEITDLVRDLFGSLNPLSAQSAALNSAITQLTTNPNEAIAAMVSIALVPTPWTDVVVATLMRAPLQIALEYSLADEKAARDMAIWLTQLEERTGAQIAASLPFLPEQTAAQVAAALPFVPAQTRAAWDATRPLLGEQAREKYEAEKPLLPGQAADSWEADKPLLGEQAREKYEAEKPLLPGQAVDSWGADKPLLLEQAEEKARADLAASIAVRPENMPGGAAIAALFQKIISDDAFRGILQRSGMPEDQIDAFILGSRFYPTPQDLVSWVGKEVFEPESVKKYGLADEFDLVDISLFEGAGVSEQFALNFWIEHWAHPSLGQLATMLHRDILFDPAQRDSVRPLSDEWRALRARATKEAEDWLRLVEIPPYARAALIAQLYRPLSRVDIRRMYDFGVLSDDDVLRGALDLGYDERGARAYLLFVKVAALVPDITAAYGKGWLDEQDVLDQLRAIGLPEDAVLRIFQSKIKAPSQLETTARERDVTKAEIVKGVKQELLTAEEGEDLLRQMGYSEWEARYILAVNVTDAASKPGSYFGFLSWVRLGRQSAGFDAQQVPAELVELGEQIHELRQEVKRLSDDPEEGEKVANMQKDIRQLQRRLDGRAAALGFEPRHQEDGK